MTLLTARGTMKPLFVDYFRVANEKIVECEVVRDRLGMMIQVGAVPAK